MKIFAASAGGLRPKDTRGHFFLPEEGGFGAFSVSSARGFLCGRSALKYKRENRNFLYQTFLFRFLGFCLTDPRVYQGFLVPSRRETYYVLYLVQHAPIPRRSTAGSVYRRFYQRCRLFSGFTYVRVSRRLFNNMLHTSW